MLRALYDGLLDLLAPAACASCAAQVVTGEPFCGGCQPLLDALPLDAVGLPYRAVFRYGGPIADAIRRLKYEGFSEVASAVGPFMVDAIGDWQPLLDVVCPIPITPRKLRSRGYNQSGLLASQVARGLGLTFQPTWLKRMREGPRQVGQGRAARLALAQGALLALPAVRDRRILLVDDVRTTGATLREATRALEEAGARTVHQLVLAEADEHKLYTPL